MKLTQNGVKRYWDFMKLHDSVTVVLYNSTRNVLILVKQFRPPVFVSGALPSGAALTIDHLTIDWNNVPLENGVTLELCGGIIDAKLSDEEIMKNEVYEECGYDVPLKNFERIITYAVATVVYNTTRNVLVLVKQFRPAVFVCGALPSSSSNSLKNLKSMDWSKVPLEMGITLEIPGGILDEDITPEEAIKQEILEECGYDVPLQGIMRLAEYRTSTGVTGDIQWMFYAECTDKMKVSEGGGKPENGEFVEVVEMSIPEVRKFVKQKVVPANCTILVAMMLFLKYKAPKE
ncbi:unnamed protein product [Orchesella dallaii]|uniref:Nudix hydrolase domain-containing protein n=1 Tax=Orchesella dallaii TaxID=48710 RepID=A0ABP1PWX2_9HEXA